MESGRIDRLTEGQRECLRLVYMRQSSKDIARLLDISPHTVDQRLRTAMQVLEARGRVGAALMLARHEGLEPYQPLIYQSPHIADRGHGRPSYSPVNRGALQKEHIGGDRMREEQRAFVVSPPFLKARRSLPFPSLRGEENDLTLWQRLGWIMAIAIGSALAFGSVLGGLDALAQLS